MTNQLPLCSRGLRRLCLPLLLRLFPLHIARSLTVCVIHTPKRNPTVGPLGLLIPITTLLQALAMRQDVVELLLQSVVPITGLICRHTKKAHVGIRLDRRNLTSQIRETIDEGKIRPEVLLFPMWQMIAKIPRDMSSGKGTAKV